MLYGLYEADDWRFAQRLLEPGDVAVDIGANIGWYTALFVGRVQPSGRVYSIEPFPKNVARLKLFQSLLTRPSLVQIIECAVSDRTGRETLHLNLYDAGHSLLEHRGHPAFPGQVLEVETTTLDQLTRDLSIDSVGLIKIDVEGAELKVIEGGFKALESTKAVMVEITGVGTETVRRSTRVCGRWDSSHSWLAETQFD